MSLKTTLSKLEFPNFETVMKSGSNAKNKIENKNANMVMVNYYYADNRFKTSVIGEIKHEAEIPIIYIDYPEKLAFIVPDNALVYDMKKQQFEVSVNEKYTHCVRISDGSPMVDMELIVPNFPEKYEYELVTMEIKKPGKKKEDIVITPKILSSIGRAKILERTIETTNDGLMIMALIGALIGFILGLIVGIKG